MIKIKDLFPKRIRYYKQITIIYILIIVVSTCIFHKLIDEQIGAILIGINSICLLVAIHPRLKLKYKYILASIGFICLYIVLSIYSINIDSISYIMFYWPLLYAYLLPDVFSPMIISLLSSTIYLNYLGRYSNQNITGKVMGILSAAILYSVVSFLMDRLYDSSERYKELSTKDSLTGLYNLDYVIKRGVELVNKNIQVAVFIFDIDHFKAFNDTYGHMLGNSVLVQIAQKLNEEVKKYEGIPGRLGGDEFVAIIPNLSVDETTHLYDNMCELFDGMKLVGDPDLDPVDISISIGMTHSKEAKKKSIKDLLNVADMNMYYNKHTKLYSFNFIEKNMLNEREKYLLKLLSEKDMYSYVHSKYVVKYTDWILEELGYNGKERDSILRGAWLHDIGKLFISNEILRKSGKLTDDEYKSVKEHVNIGLKIIQEFDMSQEGINCLKYHHERYDGRGYPFGLKGEDISIEGRIIGVADAFSAMTIKRVYRSVFDIDEAIEELIRNKRSQFDPEIVDVFIDIINKKITNIENKN